MWSMFTVGSLGVGASDGLRASPDFPDEARPLIGPRFRFRGSAVEPSSRAVLVGGARWSPRSAARRNDLRSPPGPWGRVHRQPRTGPADRAG